MAAPDKDDRGRAEKTSMSPRVFTPSMMSAADRATEASGIQIFGLMRAAGYAVAACALRHYPAARRFVVLCGPGNNGGDGFVAAQALRDSGAEVGLYCLIRAEAIRGDAARALAAVSLPLLPIEAYRPQPEDVVIDGLFGAGLARPVSEQVASLMRAVSAARLPVIAIDLPSGVDGRTGAVLGESFEAAHCVTFMARKPAHLLMPGRALCGEIHVADIGMPQRILERVFQESGAPLLENTPDLWDKAVTALDPSAHKYRRGHLVVFSGGAISNGAARMSATAGLSAGAGLVTMAAPAEALTALSAHLTAVMLREVDDLDSVQTLLEDTRLTSFVLGPGFGRAEAARAFVRALSDQALADRSLVLDADGITAFREAPEALFSLFQGPVRLVLTPHDGEFARLFPDLAEDSALSKIDRAQAAAKRSNAVVVLKGADTVIAAPDGRAAINTNAPAWLATAGSGDVLAGIIGAHLAQGMPAFEAASSAVWRHGAAGALAGEGMTAEDLLRAIRPLPR
jgi:NAD(P)H-hydrate epimerase